jgi:hypothetical protein
MKVEQSFDAELRFRIGGPRRNQLDGFEQTLSVNSPPRAPQRLLNLLPARPRFDLKTSVG